MAATRTATWETESRSWGALIQPLSSHAKRVLCLEAIGLCLASLEGTLGATSARLARRALDLLRRRPDGPPDDEFLDALRALEGHDDRPAVASIVTAFRQYAVAWPGGLDASDVLAVMSSCHEAVVHADRGEQALAGLLTAQRDLIYASALA
jgi:hypothetical protein